MGFRKVLDIGHNLFKMIISRSAFVEGGLNMKGLKDFIRHLETISMVIFFTGVAAVIVIFLYLLLQS